MLKNDLLQVKRYLKAKNPDELVLKQIDNNLRQSVAFKYDVIYDGTYWYAWYLTDATDLIRKLPPGGVN